MTNPLDALEGALAADAVAMPVHWYYDRAALARDYGRISSYLAPKNPHPDSILWRSSYTPLNERGDILHDQARYWGQRGVHYHQFLAAGENTLNFQLAARLYEQTARTRPLRRRRVAGAVHRFHAHAGPPPRHLRRGIPPRVLHELCAWSQAAGPAAWPTFTSAASRPCRRLFAALAGTPADVPAAVQEHVALTHKDKDVLRAADCLAQNPGGGARGRTPARRHPRLRRDWISSAKVAAWSKEPDEVVIGHRLSPACYIPDAFPAALYLAWKYADDFGAGICANAQVGGDSCHRGAVVGALLGEANGVPAKWRDGLVRAS